VSTVRAVADWTSSAGNKKLKRIMKDYWSKQKVLQEESEEKDASVYE
jgi:hypothetical protein